MITTIDSNGVQLANVKPPCRKAEVSGYFSRFDPPHRAVVESTGSWYWLSDLLGEGSRQTTRCWLDHIRLLEGQIAQREE